ncbi:ATP-binding protein [Knoellia sp. S7-12]|uniref:ATP-binding protein n=1 Tax=Knoellia sp. S7-12 TaxID=3126698 RepID=UPI003367F659
MRSVTELGSGVGAGNASVPTTSAGAEHAFALLIVGGRIGTVIQMVPSLPQGMALSPSRTGYLFVWLLAAGTAAVVSVQVWRKGRPLSPRGYLVDAVVCSLVLLLGLAVIPEATRLGTWSGFQPAYAISVLCSGSAVRSNRAWGVALLAIVGSSIAFFVPALSYLSAATILGHLLTLVVLAGVGRWVALFIRRIAEDGDAARAQALELGRRDEERRAQLAIHNGAAVIRMLGDPALDDASRVLLQREAQREAARMRSYLQGHGQAGQTLTQDLGPTRQVTLPRAVSQVCDRFSDLPLHVTLDLADTVELDVAAAEALDHALASVLLNVRDHAQAETVVVHADADAHSWVLTVHDDGVGFVADPRRFGVGLREVVIAQLRPHGMEVLASSRPGIGTTITFTGGSPG